MRGRLSGVLLVDRRPGCIERLVRRARAGDDRPDGELKLLRDGGIDRNGGPRVAVDQHLAEAPIPEVLAEDRKVAVDTLADRQVTGCLADACGVRWRLDVANELDGGLPAHRVAREDDPYPSAGSGRVRAAIGHRDGSDVPLRKL